MPDSSNPSPSAFNRICDEFEDGWKQTPPPLLSDFLSKVEYKDRDALLQQLLPMDIEFRQLKLGSCDSAIYTMFGEAIVEQARELLQRSSANFDATLPPSSGSEQNPSNTRSSSGDFDLAQGLEETRDAPKKSKLADSKQIGRYKLLQEIGEGGMGTVWMAEQQEPVRRRVALKVIKAGMDTKQVIARFEAERQALAMMDNENIAKILDGGTTDDGRPYFVMELVKGIPLTKYCDNNKLSIKERLELFIPVCKAVQHAHQKGIIHRDLKPSNVLVTLYDGKAVPKVIDFGLAKALDQQSKLTDRTMFTEFGQVVGTLQYMSPEQAELNALDVDTRTDIYSLGVMLYELLTGSTPIEKKTLQNNALLQVLEVIREKEPPRPSTRLSESVDQVVGVSEQRKIEPKKLQQILRGELDWIVMKTLEKNRRRRYETANDFADDIQRYLTGDAIEARPASTAYKLQKFASKNKGLVAAAAIVTAALLSAVGISTWFAIESNQAKIRSDESAKRAADVLKIMTDSFESVDPKSGATYEMSAKDVLNKSLRNIDVSDLDDLGKASLLFTLASSFYGIGDYDSAHSAATQALEIRKRELGLEHPDTLSATRYVASSLSALGHENEAFNLRQSVHELSERHLGPEHPVTLDAMSKLGWSYAYFGHMKEALEIRQRVFELNEKIFGPEHPNTLSAMAELARSCNDLGFMKEAFDIRQRVLELNEKIFGSEHPNTLSAMAELAISCDDLGRMKEAFDIRQKVLELNEKIFGPEHPNSLSAMTHLVLSYISLGHLDEAFKLQQKQYELCEKVFGPEHPSFFLAMHILANCHQFLGHADEAFELRLKHYELSEKKIGPEHPNTLSAMENLTISHRSLGHLDEAFKLAQKLYELRLKILGPKHPSTLSAMELLASTHDSLGLADEAFDLRQKVYELRRKVLGPKHLDTLRAMDQLAFCFRGQKEPQKALKLSKRAAELYEDTIGLERPKSLNALFCLAYDYEISGQNEKSTLVYEKVLGLRKKVLGAQHIDTLATIRDLANHHLKLGRVNQFLELQRELVAIKSEKLGNSHREVLLARFLLATNLPILDEKIKALTSIYESQLKALGTNDKDSLATMNQLVVAYHGAGDYEKSASLSRKMHQVRREKLGANDSLTLNAYNGFVWCKTFKVAKVEGPILSVPELNEMRRIASLKPIVGSYSNTLGLAEYRNRNFKEAVAAAMISVEHTPKQFNLPGPHAIDLAILAMSHLRLGDKKKAIDYRSQLSQAMQSVAFKDDAECKMFVAEVDALFEKGAEEEASENPESSEENDSKTTNETVAANDK